MKMMQNKIILIYKKIQNCDIMLKNKIKLGQQNKIGKLE